MNRRWTLLLPVIFITYSLAYLDRANFSFAAAGGMAKDLGITAAQNSLLGALFFLGYFLFQIPGAAYAQKYSVKKLILWGLIGWGLLATATGPLKLAGAELHWTSEDGPINKRKWQSSPATIEGETLTAVAPPADTTAWFLTVADERGAVPA